MGQIFVYLLTGGGAICSLLRPIYGLCAYIMLAVVRPEVVWKWSIQPGNYSRIVGIALLIGWAMRGFGGLRFGRAAVPAAALAAFWGWSLICSLTSSIDMDQWIYMDNLTKIVLPVLAGLTLIQTKKDLQLVAWTLGLSTAFLAFRENETYLSYGLLVGDNQTAHSMAAYSGFLFFLGIGTKRWWLRLPLLMMSLAAAHAVMFHMSRGAMVGMAVMALLTIIIIPKTPLFYGILICVALAGVRLAGPQVVKEFLTTFDNGDARDESAESRTRFWKAMAEATIDSPLVGVGPRNWKYASYHYGIPGREGHNAWLQLMAETGIPGISFILLYYGYIMRRLFPWAMGRLGPEYEELRPFAQMFVVSFSCWFVCQIFGSFYLVEFPYYLAMMGAGLLNVSATVTRPSDDEAWEEEWDEGDENSLAVEGSAVLN